MIRSQWMLMLAGTLAAIGCEQSRMDGTFGMVTSADVRRDAGPLDKTTAAHATQSKEEYQQQLDIRLKGMDAEIAMLQEKNCGLKGGAKVDWDRTLSELQARRDSAYARLAEVRRSSADAWKDAKNGAQLAGDDLDSALRDAARHF
jgi:hypothetical protein